MQTTAEEAADIFISDCGIKCDSTFVPWDGGGQPQLKWNIALMIHGDKVWSGHFTAGIGHAPSYPKGAAWDECRTGRDQRGKAIHPRLRDVVSSLAIDARALDYQSFEDWAGDFGLDTDSRKAESMYRECLRCGVALRAGLGSQNFDRLLELCSEL
jgi:hypothetical protein